MFLKNLLKVSARYALSVIILSFWMTEVNFFEKDFSENNELKFLQKILL